VRITGAIQLYKSLAEIFVGEPSAVDAVKQGLLLPRAALIAIMLGDAL
jgi:hypothetical protein